MAADTKKPVASAWDAALRVPLATSGICVAAAESPELTVPTPRAASGPQSLGQMECQRERQALGQSTTSLTLGKKVRSNSLESSGFDRDCAAQSCAKHWCDLLEGAGNSPV